MAVIAYIHIAIDKYCYCEEVRIENYFARINMNDTTFKIKTAT
jgi:hypothetical protein